MGLHMKPDIDSDISLSAVTDVFCILRDLTMCCINVGFNCVSIEGHLNMGHGSSYVNSLLILYTFRCAVMWAVWVERVIL